MRRTITGLAAALAVAVLTTTASAGVASARLVPDGPVGPPAYDFASAYSRSLLHPAQMPPGVNDWSCEPSAEHPNPVVLIHGTWDSAYGTWPMLAPVLAEEGYCVFAVQYGDEEASWFGNVPGMYGTGDMVVSGDEVASFVRRVRDATGTGKVDLVGHSQGGTMARLVVQDHGGWRPDGGGYVGKVVGLGANNHGTALSGIAQLGRTVQDFGVPVLDVAGVPLGRAPIQQAIGDPFFDRLNAGGETRPGIDHTMITTRYDEIVSPYTSSFLAQGPGATVHDVVVQDGCEQDYSEHLSLTYDPRALWYVRAALDPAVSERETPPCVPVAPLGGEVPSGSVGSAGPAAPAGPQGAGVA